MSSSTFNASDGDGYELQMGRWSRQLAPLFIEFADVRAGAKVLAGVGAAVTGPLAPVGAAVGAYLGAPSA